MTELSNLANEIVRELERYSTSVQEEMEVFKKETAQELVSDLKQSSPKKTGSYRKGWRSKKVGKSYVIHNKTDYQLTHLLEHGHAKIGGGRVAGKAHIAPAEERAVSDYLEKIEQAIKQ